MTEEPRPKEMRKIILDFELYEDQALLLDYLLFFIGHRECIVDRSHVLTRIITRYAETFFVPDGADVVAYTKLLTEQCTTRAFR